MKRSHRIASWTAGIATAVVVLVILVIAFFDWNRLKPFIDDKVSQAIGRPFAINGDLTVAWRREPLAGGVGAWVSWPEFTARDIHIANPGFARQADFAHLDALRFRLSPLALLFRRIEVPLVQLVKPSVDLERNANGQATWDFTLAANRKASSWKLDLGAIGFDEGTASIDDAVSRTRLRLTLTPMRRSIPYAEVVAQQSTEAEAQAAKLAGGAAPATMSDSGKGKPARKRGGTPGRTDMSYQFTWKADGSSKGVPASGSGRIGSVLALQRRDRPFPVQAQVHIGDSRITLVGTLTDPMHLGALDLELWFAGTSMANLYPIIGVTLPDTPPYATAGHLQAQRTGPAGKAMRFSYKDFSGRMGGSDLSGSLEYVGGGARPKLNGTLVSQDLQFRDLAPVIGADASASRKQRGDDTPQPADKVLPVEPFRTDRWQAMDADVHFTARHITHLPGLPIQSLQTHVRMDDGVLRLHPLDFTLAGGKVESRLSLDGSKSPMPGKLEMSARHLKLKQLFPNSEPMHTSFGEIDGDLGLDVRGNSVAALLGDANGEVKLLMNDGAISKTLLEEAGLNIANVVIRKLFGDKTVPINCAAADLVARDGLFDTRLFVFDTGDATINVSGQIDLASEKVDLQIKPHTKGFRILSLRTPLYVNGTLKHPGVGVEPGPLLLRGGAAVALGVVAASAAALLALIAPSHDTNGENTCRRVLQQMNAPSRTNAGHGKIKPAKVPAS